jgi:SAM-dependent methyltransferase
MPQVTLDPTPGPYVLATGEAAAYRLRLLHGLYGEGTRRVLLNAGLRRGMRAADLGCGVGTVTALLSELVGPEGHVVGIDASAAQLAQARRQLHGDGRNMRFVEASATATGLPPASFDLVYCRFLLIHLPEPERALGEMRALLKPGGILVCEDGDLTSAGSEPPSALDAFAELWGRLGPKRGVDYRLGRRLFQMVQAAGFPEPGVTLRLPTHDALQCALRCEIGSTSVGWPHWKEVSNAPPYGRSDGSPGHLHSKGLGGPKHGGKRRMRPSITAKPHLPFTVPLASAVASNTSPCGRAGGR